MSLGQRDAQTWMVRIPPANAHASLIAYVKLWAITNKWTDYSRLTIDPKEEFL